MKKKVCFITIMIYLYIIVCFSVSLLIYDHSTYYKYNDRFILGNTAENVVARYGEFDFKAKPQENGRKGYSGYYIEPYFYWDIFLFDSYSEAYCIFWNEDGEAYDVAICKIEDFGPTELPKEKKEGILMLPIRVIGKTFRMFGIEIGY